MVANPYATSRLDDQFGKPEYPPTDPAYVEPEQLGPYAPAGMPFSTVLAYRFNDTPDPYRVQREPVPQGIRQPATGVRAWWARLVSERQSREAVQAFSAPVQELQVDAGQSGQRFARRAGEIPLPNTRVTQSLSPATGGMVTRPFTGRTPQRFNGVHASMADHKRLHSGEGSQFGMVPPRHARMTWRADVVSWGENVQDRQAQQDYTPDATYTQNDVPLRNPNYRLV